MNDNIIKPMSVMRQEFIGQIIDAINNCKLPLFVIEYILQDVLDTVRSTAKQQCEMEAMQYEKLLKQQDKDTNE